MVGYPSPSPSRVALFLISGLRNYLQISVFQDQEDGLRIGNSAKKRENKVYNMVSGYCGLLLGSPVILYFRSSSVLFYAGITFSPAALMFFVSYSEGVVESLWSIDQYFEFVLMLMFSTGLSFQVPVIQLLLGQTGLVSSEQMLSVWRYVVVGSVVAAAIPTPSTDPLTQMLLAGTLMGLYLGGAWAIRLLGR